MKKGNFFTRLFYDESGNEVQGTESEKTTVESAEDINVSNTGGSVGTEVENPAENLEVTSSGDGVFDKKFEEALNQLISENDIPGVDYVELKKALKGMGSVSSMDESIAIKSAFASLKAVDSSLTAQKILESVDFYMGLIDKEEEQFEAAMQAEISEKVSSLRDQAEEKLNENKTYLQQIQELNEKISANQTEASELKKKAAHAEININQTHKNFSATISSVRDNMKSDKEKISTSIVETTGESEETKA